MIFPSNTLEFRVCLVSSCDPQYTLSESPFDSLACLSSQKMASRCSVCNRAGESLQCGVKYDGVTRDICTFCTRRAVKLAPAKGMWKIARFSEGSKTPAVATYSHSDMMCMRAYFDTRAPERVKRSYLVFDPASASRPLPSLDCAETELKRLIEDEAFDFYDHVSLLSKMSPQLDHLMNWTWPWQLKDHAPVGYASSIEAYFHDEERKRITAVLANFGVLEPAGLHDAVDIILSSARKRYLLVPRLKKARAEVARLKAELKQANADIMAGAVQRGEMLWNSLCGDAAAGAAAPLPPVLTSAKKRKASASTTEEPGSSGRDDKEETASASSSSSAPGSASASSAKPMRRKRARSSR